MPASPRKKERLRKIFLTVNNSTKAVITTLLNIQKEVILNRMASLFKGTIKSV